MAERLDWTILLNPHIFCIFYSSYHFFKPYQNSIEAEAYTTEAYAGTFASPP
jgi:hypothetical protein